MKEADARECARVRDTLELCLPIAEDAPTAYGSTITIRQEIRHIEQNLTGNGSLPDCPKCGCWERPDVRLGDRWTVRCRECGYRTRGQTLTEALTEWEDAAWKAISEQEDFA